MDSKSLFWKLGAFSKFDFKRFSNDAVKLNVLTSEKEAKSPNKKVAQVSTRTSIEKTTEQDQVNQNSESQDLPKRKKKKKKTAAQIAALKEEETRELRNHHHIHVHGSDIPDPLKTFNELESKYGLNNVVLRNIEHQDYAGPTGIQRQVIPAMIQGRDVMACAPTGSGKTAAFIIPVLHHLKTSSEGGFRALVLAPTRELAKQILREFRKLSKGLGLHACYIETEEKAKKKSQEQTDIVVTTPNRLIFMLQQDPPPISINNVEWLIVDESDKLFEAGDRGFRDQLGAIYKACSSAKLHRAMFSATFAHEVEEWCKLNLDNVLQVHVGARNSAIKAVEQELVFTGDETGKLLAFRNLIRQGISPPVLVFVQSKERAAHLFMELKYDNLKLDVIHSGRPQDQRDAVIQNFRLGKTWVLICTELMGRGIDFKGVNLVVNYDFPTSAISYIHRVGRTGRAGKQGKAVTFFTEVDKANLRSIANVIKQAGCPVPEYMLSIKKPNKKELRKMAKRVPERKAITTLDRKQLANLKQRKGTQQKSNQAPTENRKFLKGTKNPSGVVQKKGKTGMRSKHTTMKPKVATAYNLKKNKKKIRKQKKKNANGNLDKTKRIDANPKQMKSLKRKRKPSNADTGRNGKRAKIEKTS